MGLGDRHSGRVHRAHRTCSLPPRTSLLAPSNQPLQQSTATHERLEVGDAETPRATLAASAAVIRSSATLAFAAERQVVSRTDATWLCGHRREWDGSSPLV